jgi:hypothetical protein
MAVAFQQSSRIRSAGRSHRYRHDVGVARTLADCRSLILAAPPHLKLLPFGAGQSLGDVCLNDGGALIVTREMAKILSFDRADGTLTCEPGVTFGQIANETLSEPGAWLPFVFPGTTAVTMGGAIANDIHGKNHLLHGSFCHHVRSIELLRSDGSVTLCSERDNAELFRATLGGLGLTGIIVSATFRLRPVPGPIMECESIRLERLADAFPLFSASTQEWEYCYSWHDPFDPAGRGVFVRCRHVAGVAHEAEPPSLLMRMPPACRCRRSSEATPCGARGTPSCWRKRPNTRDGISRIAMPWRRSGISRAGIACLGREDCSTSSASSLNATGLR